MNLMPSRQNRISFIIEEAFQKAVNEGMQRYLNTSVDERQKLESQGYNINSFIYEAIAPILYNTRIKSILIIMEEGIGNMVMLTPALEMLRKFNSRVHITILCKPLSAEVIRNWNVVDEIIHEMDNKFYDICITTIWGKGWHQKYFDQIKNQCKSNFDIQFRPQVSEHIQQLALADFFDAAGEIPLPHCDIAVGELAKEVDKILDKINIKRKEYIVFGDTTLHNYGWDRKKWPFYKELAEKINKKFSTPIFLIGDEEDKKIFEKIEWPENVHLDFCSTINVPQLAYLIKNSKFYIGNDTGPTHIAAAVGTKTYAIFGPTILSKNQPIGTNVTILNNSMWCSPCQYTPQWDECDTFNCMNQLSADEVYSKIFHPDNSLRTKKRVLLVGDTSPGHYRVELGIRRILEKEFKMKVYLYEYRKQISKYGPVDGTFGILNEVINKDIDYVLICGGNGLVPQIFNYKKYICPKVKIFNWYTDQRGGLEPWWIDLGACIDKSFWTTGGDKFRTEFYSITGKDYTFLPSAPDDEIVYPMDIEKEYDVVFIGTPHSPDRIQLLTMLSEQDIKLKIFGDGQWPEHLKKYVSPSVYGEEFVKALNRAKIVVNTNMFNNIPLYTSDRYFMGLAAKVCSVNQMVPELDTMFENNVDMVLFNTNEEAISKVIELLNDDKKRNEIAENGYKLYKENYTLKYLLGKIFYE